MSDIKPIKNVGMNPQSFLETSPSKKKSFPQINCKTIHKSGKILSDQRKITSHRKIVRINGVIYICDT